MKNLNVFEVITIVLMIGSSVPYAIRTYQNKANPNTTSYLLWCLMNIVFALTYVSSQEDIHNILGVTAGIFNCFIIIIVSGLRNPKKYKPDFWEWACIILCVAILILWIFMRDNIMLMKYSLYATITADVFASIPQLRNSWNEPEKDRPLPWIMVTTSYGIGLLLTRTNTFTGYMLPAYMFISCFAITLPLVVYNIKNKSKFFLWI